MRFLRLFLIFTASAMLLMGCNKHQTREAASPSPTAKKLTRINKHWNNYVKYKLDGPEDHWQSPEETLALGTGDCEDLVIVKMFDPDITQAYSPDEIRLAYVHTPDRTPHMVLIVGLGDERFVLDNLADKVVTLQESRYQPVYELDLYGRVYREGKWLKDHKRLTKLDNILQHYGLLDSRIAGS